MRRDQGKLHLGVNPGDGWASEPHGEQKALTVPLLQGSCLDWTKHSRPLSLFPG